MKKPSAMNNTLTFPSARPGVAGYGDEHGGEHQPLTRTLSLPSVSEPFGIAPLEAMRNDVPVIISRQSGVSEVLTHALKVDFWDIDDMANKIVAVLRHPPLGQTLRNHGAFELRRLTWDGAAQKCEEVYQRMIDSQRDVALA